MTYKVDSEWGGCLLIVEKEFWERLGMVTGQHAVGSVWSSYWETINEQDPGIKKLMGLLKKGGGRKGSKDV